MDFGQGINGNVPENMNGGTNNPGFSSLTSSGGESNNLQMVPPAPVDGGGDIILGNNKKPKVWKWVIIAVLIVLVIGVVLFPLWKGGVFGGGGNGGETEKNSTTAREAFGKYVDLLSSSEGLWFNDEQLAELETYYNDFKNNTTLDVSGYTELFNMFMTFKKHPLPMRYSVFSKVHNDGRTAAVDYLLEIEEKYKEYTDVYGHDCGALVSGWADVIVRIAVVYNKIGCLNEEGAVDFACVKETGNEEYKGLDSELAEKEYYLDLIKGGIEEDLVNGFWSIDEELREVLDGTE